jgi:hypothetical protein
MRIRPGRTRSIFVGIIALVVMLVGVWMLQGVGGWGSPPWPFLAIWVLVGLGGAAAAFYNAFSKSGLPLYEVDTGPHGPQFCPQCGQGIGSNDAFCRHCGVALE